MDNLAFRLGNRLVGNPAGAAGLEVTALGPTLRFHQKTTVCLTGADCDARLDGELVERYAPIPVAPGQTLKLGRVQGSGLRAYILFVGGLEVPPYLGSRSTFTLGRFGGHGGRNLAAGDVLHLSAEVCSDSRSPALSRTPSVSPTPSSSTFGRPLPRTEALPREVSPLPAVLRPPLTREWTIRVLYGPHGAPDFFTQADIDTLLSASWKVHYNSSRTGVRLTGPKPQWARRDGGEAGLHPSNIHDNAYAVGAIDFTGDMPIILGPDGPSLGGFVCPFVVIAADLWKVGQLAPGDRICFESVSEAAASEAEHNQDALIDTLGEPPPRERGPKIPEHTSAIVGTFAARGTRPKVVYRRQGDHHLLVEYGEMLLDVTLRLRVHALMLELERIELPGVFDITPGIRSLQIHYDPRVLPLAQLVRTLGDAEDRLGELQDFEIPSRVIWLPLSFNDPAVAETIARYTASVRADAPWCPDNIEFIRRINGLSSIDDVRKIVFDARYLVMGLGDVYLGAPVAIPLDPRHRLVTTKYNPARTWTPPNVVGIGGAYMCIYGMEGPGGYQLFGRTIQVWSSYGQTRDFRDGKPWLLRFFDQIRFFPVTHAELTEWRRDFPHGRRPLKIESEPFKLSDYRRFLHEQQSSIAAFQATRQAAFNAEREEWARNNEFSREDTSEESSFASVAFNAPPGTDLIEAPLGGNIWRIHVRPGDRVERGSNIAAIEAMKTECNVPSPSSGTVRAVYVRERQEIAPGMPIIALEPDLGSQPVAGK
jgi:urea carboxylase